MKGQANSWQEWTPASMPSSRPDAIQVLAFSLTPVDGQIDGFERVLSPTERARADRYVRVVDRHRYVVAHAVLRQILSRLIGCTPRELIVERSAGGRPHVIGVRPDVRFSLAHSGDLGLVALSTRQVGVDVEHHQDSIDWREIARRFLPARARRAVHGLSAEVQLSEVFAAWPRYEATLKLHGTGLANPVSSTAARARAAWADNLPVGPGLAAAVASPIPRAPVHLNRWVAS